MSPHPVLFLYVHVLFVLTYITMMANLIYYNYKVIKITFRGKDTNDWSEQVEVLHCTMYYIKTLLHVYTLLYIRKCYVTSTEWFIHVHTCIYIHKILQPSIIIPTKAPAIYPRKFQPSILEILKPSTPTCKFTNKGKGYPPGLLG